MCLVGRAFDAQCWNVQLVYEVRAGKVVGIKCELLGFELKHFIELEMRKV